MLISDRWISIKQVRNELSELSSNLGEEFEHSFDPDDRGNNLTWRFCELATTVRLYPPNGRTKDALKEIIKRPDPLMSSSMNDHICLDDGWLGSGNKREEIFVHEDAHGNLRDCHHEYGPNLGLLVVFEKKDFEKFKKFLIEGQEPQIPKSLASVRDSILKEYHSGHHQNKKTTKEKIGPISNRSFQLGWSAAVEVEPALSKPGAKPKQHSDSKSND